ncbi:helix-turn-helix transcriptional regulator [Shinella sumterensis]|uniref:helix-turn-helix transcriptional regulator n=1 Tax=Rhizobiaceae TaxID=82115 RepID=UPI001FDEA730|nr:MULTISPECIES: helix-turn-helix transcriptional regulator [Rhizobiaceae]WLS08696.1 helix-turn-helix transcriptional regulator [Shinella sumterensis]
MLTMEQCRWARAMLGWSQGDLATAATVSRQTIADFERGAHIPITNNLSSIVKAFRKAGIEFIPEDDGRGVGIRFRAPVTSRAADA